MRRLCQPGMIHGESHCTLIHSQFITHSLKRSLHCSGFTVNHSSDKRLGVKILEVFQLTGTQFVESSFYSIKWPTVLVRNVKAKLRHFKACLCGSLYSTFNASFSNDIDFITNGFKRFSWTNSTDPSKRVPLSTKVINILMLEALISPSFVKHAEQLPRCFFFQLQLKLTLSSVYFCFIKRDVCKKISVGY